MLLQEHSEHSLTQSFNMVDIATWVVLATPIFVFVFLKAFDCWTADWRLRKRTQWKVPSARRNTSALQQLRGPASTASTASAWSC